MRDCGGGSHQRCGFPAWRTGLTSLVLLWAIPAAAQVAYTGSIFAGRTGPSAEERTDAVYVIHAVDFERGRLRVSATVPWLIQRSRWIDAELTPVDTGWQSGLSDPVFRIDAEAWRSRTHQLRLGIAGAVKVPVADADSGFGTGQADVALGFSVRSTNGRDAVIADVTFWMLNDAPEVNYRDVPTFFVGYIRVLDQEYRWSALLSIGGGPSVIAGLGAPVQVSGALLRTVGRRSALGLSLDVGVTSGAADYAVGATWRFTF